MRKNLQISSTSKLSKEIELQLKSDYRVTFSKQFSYHLKDVPLENYDINLDPVGYVNVHLPNITSIRVPFHPLMDIEQFKMHIQVALDESFNQKSKNSEKFDCNDFHLVTSNGVIEKNMTLDCYSIQNESDILMVSKGVSTAEIRKQRDYWLKKREKRISSSSTPREPKKEKTPEQLAKIRKTLSKRSRFGSKYSFKWI